MIPPKNKHAVNGPRGQDANTIEPPLVFKPRLFKSEKIQKMWLSNFKERTIITERDFKVNFPLKYYKRMLVSVEALGWDVLLLIPKDMYSNLTRFYSNLMRFFYYNLEVENLDDIEYTIETK